MTDLDALTSYAQRWIELHRENKYQREAAKIMQRVVEALTKTKAERDAALARIAELEAEKAETLNFIRVNAKAKARWRRLASKTIREAEARIAELEKSRDGWAANAMEYAENKARIAEVAKLHRKYTYYDLEDSCPDTTDEHREEHHHESDEIGEFYCDQMPTGDVACDNCRDVNGDRMDWPCDTARLLGLNEGENDERIQPAANVSAR